MKKKISKYLVIVAIIVCTLFTAVAILMKNSTRLIEYQLRETLGKGFSVRDISVTWGKIEATGISLQNDWGREVLSTNTLILNTDFRTVFHKDHIISSLVMNGPYLLIETDRKGAIVNPVFQKKTKQETPSPSFFLNTMKIENGSLDYLNGKIASPPFLTGLRNIHLEFQKIHIPFNNDFSPYSLTADIPGRLHTGTLKSKGKIKLESMDAECTVALNGLDISGVKPYFHRKGDVDVTRGLLDIDMTIKISDRKIYAPGRAVLRDLQFRSGEGTGQKFLSLPLHAVMGFLKDNKDQIAFDFTLEGDFNNPNFNVRQSFVEKIALGIAEKLGLSVTNIGESIIDLGSEGLKQVGKGIKGVGEGIRDIFK